MALFGRLPTKFVQDNHSRSRANVLRGLHHPIGRIDLGQSTAMWSGNRFALGFSNESEWWGPPSVKR